MKNAGSIVCEKMGRISMRKKPEARPYGWMNGETEEPGFIVIKPTKGTVSYSSVVPL